MLEKIIETARSAGDAILGFYDDDVEVERKEDNSPLTKADLAAHHIIVDALEELTPDIPVISEEGGIADYEERKSWPAFWLVDPLDGTKEFIKKNGEFTVNIALIESGIPVLGVVHIPVDNCTYIGTTTNGSEKINGDGSRTRLVSTKPDIRTPLTVIASRSHASDDLAEKLAEKNIQIGKTVSAGSSLKFCLLAEGKADIYPRFGPTMEWDTAAGDAVYRYSGADEPRPSPIRYNKPSLKNEGFIIGLE